MNDVRDVADAGRPASGPADDDLTVLAGDARDAALAVDGVTRLSTGPFGEIATYLPGRRNVPGIRVTSTELHVHVVVAATAMIREVAAHVHEAVTGTADGRRVVVHVDDLDPVPAPRPGNEGRTPSHGAGTPEGDTR